MKGINQHIEPYFEEMKLIKSGGSIFIASFLGAILLLTSNLVLSNHLGPENFGNFKTIVSLFIVISVLTELGSGVTITRYTAKFLDERVNCVTRWFFKLRILLYVVSLAIVFIFREEIALYFLGDTSMTHFVIAGMILLAFIFFDIFKSIPLGFQNFRLYSLSKLVTSASVSLFTLILGYLFGVCCAIIGWGLGYFTGSLLNIRFSFRKDIFKKTERRLNVGKIFTSYSIPIYLMTFPEVIETMILPILSLFFEQKLIGYYAFALIFYRGVLLIPNALSQTMLPKFSELDELGKRKKAKKILNRIFIIYSVIVFLGVIGCLVFSGRFISFIAPGYLAGLIAFRSLVCFGLLTGYLLIYRSYLTALAKVERLALVVLIHNISLLSISFFVMTLL